MENERNETLYSFAPAALKCGNKCMALLNPHLIELKSDMVTEIKIENVHGFCHDFIIEVQHHLEKKYWRIISNYLYYNEKDHSISIPVISPQKLIPVKVCVTFDLNPYGKSIENYSLIFM